VGTFGSVLFYISFALFGFAQVLTPSRLGDFQVINFNEGASIKLSRAAPPIAAMEDSLNEESPEAIVERPARVVRELMASAPILDSKIGEVRFASQVLSLETTTIKKSLDKLEEAPLKAAKTFITTEPIKIKSAPAGTSSYYGSRAEPKETTPTPTVPQQKNQHLEKKPDNSNYHSFTEPTPQIISIQVYGEVELAGGLAFLGSEQELTIFRVKEDKYLEQGEVRTREGRFSINVEGLSGKLVAELKDAEGNPYGRGEFYLEKAIGSQDKSGAVRGIKIKLYNSDQGVSGTALSAYSFEDKEIPVAGAKVAMYEMNLETATDENGHFHFAETDRDSMVLVSTTAKKYWPSLSILNGGQKNEVKMFPVDMVNALLAIVGNKMQVQDWKKAGIIWGQVKSLGKPVAGAKVELAGASNLKPIYFNGGYFPDLKKEVTGEDGYFVYLGVSPGIYQVRAMLADRIIDGGVIQALPEYLSFVELKMAEVINPTEFRLHDLFDPESDLAGQVRILGTEQSLNPKKDTIDFDYAREMIFVEALATQPYSAARMSTKPQSKIDIPLVSESWLAGIVAESRRLRDSELGTVLIAFSEPIDQIYINGELTQELSKNIVYFDHEGKLSESPKNLRAGGALLINLPLGLQNISVRAAGQNQLRARLIISDPGIINVFSAVPTQLD